MYNKNEAWHNFRKRKFLFLKRISKKPPSPPPLSRLYNSHSRPVYSSVLSILVRSTKLGKLDESTKERPGAVSVQCRVRACTSFPRLPRARALTYRKERTSPSLSLAVSPLLCVYTSLSRSPFLSRYIRICCLSLLRVCIYVCILF